MKPLLLEIEDELLKLPLLAYHFFDSVELSFSERIRTICKTECPMYGKSWACPPAVGSVQKCREKCLSYKKALLIATVTEVNDIANIEETLETRPEHERVTHEATRLFIERGIEVYTLSCEACSFCEECTYPNGDCRFPEKMNPCIESHGIIMTELCEKLGIDYLFGGNIVTWFSLIFFNEV